MEGILLTPWIEADIIIRLMISGIIGGVLGWERHVAAKPAGTRTHALVGMGASLVTSLSIYAFGAGDVSRLAAAVVIGIGFIGGGTILTLQRQVIGLTSAALVWVVAVIGIALGVGYYAAGVSAAVLAFLVLKLPW